MAATATKAEIEERLAVEAVERPRGAAAAFTSAALTLAGTVYSATALSDQPNSSMLNTLSEAAKPGPVGALPSSRVPLFDFYSNHKFALYLGAILLALAALSAGYSLLVLQNAVRPRSERFPNYGKYLPSIGAAAVGLGSLISVVGTTIYTDAALDTARTVDAIDDVSRTVLTIGLIIVQFGGLVLAAAYIVTSLHAMRTGLLSRAWGIIGIFAGIMVVLPVAALSQLIQPLWLIVLGLILIGRFPGGIPPAWNAGVAVPWPSAADEARRKRDDKDRGAGKPVAEQSAPEPFEPPAEAKPHSSSKKKKSRKRRT